MTCELLNGINFSKYKVYEKLSEEKMNLLTHFKGMQVLLTKNCKKKFLKIAIGTLAIIT